ncbi:Phenylalanine--tRNA ligase alpha subunit [Bienertia sinuspersici]
MTDQMIHCVIKPSGGLEEFFCTFIYAHNDAKLRESLWENLRTLNSKLWGPWLLMGDFNCVINIEERIGSAETLHKEPLNTDLMQNERDAFSKYVQAHKNYMQYLRQKAKAYWIKEGDDNTALFHSCIRKRILQNNVYAIRDMGGVMQDTPEGIQGAFVDYYKELLGKAKEGRTQATYC